mmetsp:Transcript_12100/g.36296  ORF Transcript_12100/g.36296 Transcript_12100/m.36296 type:complete len:249 (-) Transcript_12100:2102-2848(-)
MGSSPGAAISTRTPRCWESMQSRMGCRRAPSTWCLYSPSSRSDRRSQNMILMPMKEQSDSRPSVSACVAPSNMPFTQWKCSLSPAWPPTSAGICAASAWICCHHSRTRFSCKSSASARRARLLRRTTRDAADTAATLAASLSRSACAWSADLGRAADAPDACGVKDVARLMLGRLPSTSICAAFAATCFLYLVMGGTGGTSTSALPTACSTLMTSFWMASSMPAVRCSTMDTGTRSCISISASMTLSM